MEIQTQELEHHGIKNQTWGVRRGPPYPLDRNSQKQAAKKKAAAAKKAQKTKKKNAAAKKKAEEKSQKEAKKAEEKTQKEAKRRAAILADPGKLYRNRHQFTKEDIESAMARFDWEQKVQQYHMNRTTYAATVVGNYVKLAGNVVNAYNTVAGVYNAWFPDEPLPVVKTNVNQQSGKDNKKK